LRIGNDEHDRRGICIGHAAWNTERDADADMFDVNVEVLSTMAPLQNNMTLVAGCVFD
jgi:hypothetical protein